MTRVPIFVAIWGCLVVVAAAFGNCLKAIEPSVKVSDCCQVPRQFSIEQIEHCLAPIVERDVRNTLSRVTEDDYSMFVGLALYSPMRRCLVQCLHETSSEVLLPGNPSWPNGTEEYLWAHTMSEGHRKCRNLVNKMTFPQLQPGECSYTNTMHLDCVNKYMVQNCIKSALPPNYDTNPGCKELANLADDCGVVGIARYTFETDGLHVQSSYTSVDELIIYDSVAVE